MAIRPRIKPLAVQSGPDADERVIAAIINRGGAPAAAETGPVRPDPASLSAPVNIDPEKKFTLRLPSSLLAAIEKDAKDRPDRVSVNTWLIAAALQRLQRS